LERTWTVAQECGWAVERKARDFFPTVSKKLNKSPLATAVRGDTAED
jgi:hypothetical protein